MKFIFVTGLYPKEKIDVFRKWAKGDVQNAADAFQWAVIDGLIKNEADFQIVNCPFLPSFPINNKCFRLPKLDGKYGDNHLGVSLPYCTVPIVKSRSIVRLLFKTLRPIIEEAKMKNGEEGIVIITYSVYSPFLKVLKRLKRIFPGLVTASIVTDLPDNMLEFNANQRFLKRIYCYFENRRVKKLYRYIDKYVLLAAPMEERIPEAQGRNCIVEGMVVPSPLPLNKKYSKNKVILYTGTLDAFSGVRELVKAFQRINEPNYRLMICGGGVLENMIRKASIEDPRIVYKGMVTREDALRLQKEATALINPRRPDNGITRFSFPSKTMEYMMSGTSMIGYKLDGIPKDYFDYIYTINETSVDALSAKIQEILSIPESELNARAIDAYNFIINNKTSDKQVHKIISFLSDNSV